MRRCDCSHVSSRLWPAAVHIFPKILKLGRPLVTAEVMPDNLIMINTDK